MSNDVNFKEGSFFDSDPELQSCQIMLFFFLKVRVSLVRSKIN